MTDKKAADFAVAKVDEFFMAAGGVAGGRLDSSASLHHRWDAPPDLVHGIVGPPRTEAPSWASDWEHASKRRVEAWWHVRALVLRDEPRIVAVGAYT